MTIGALAGEVARSLIKKPATERYPFERRPSPVSLRGKLSYDPARCTGCQLCTIDCPSRAIELITLDRANKRFVMRYHVDRCTFCSQCVQECRFKCLELSNDRWELASTDKQDFVFYYGKPEDIATVLDGSAQGNASSAEPEAS
jgi:formate hydrogenlyase subunit 6/NADH:ubiquinone oxidoreductase subunit I